MSWFSLIQAEKTILDSQSFFQSALTGQFISIYAVDNVLNKNQAYVKTKEAAAKFFSKKLCSPLDCLSVKISENFLERVISNEKFSELFPEKVLVDGLKPFCRRAIKKGFKVLVQKGVETGIDSAVEKGISFALIMSVYYIATSLLSSARFNKDSSLCHTMDFMQTYLLPTPAKLLSALTAFHIAGMIVTFWKAQHLKLVNTDLNKKQVIQLVINLTIDPIKNTLKNKPNHKALCTTFTEEKIDAFISVLIAEIIDSHWDEIHNIRFLNLPLVT